MPPTPSNSSLATTEAVVEPEVKSGDEDCDEAWILNLESTIIKFRVDTGSERRDGEVARGARTAYRPVSVQVLLLTILCVIWDLLCFGVMIHSFEDVQKSKASAALPRLNGKLAGKELKSEGPKKFLVWLLACLLPMAIVGIMLAMTVTKEWRKARQNVGESPQIESHGSQTMSNFRDRESFQLPI